MLNKINIKSAPNQTFTTTLNVNGKNTTYLFLFSYRDKIGYWTMSVSDYESGKKILTNVPLLRINDGKADFDLFKQFAYKLIGSLFLVKEFEVDGDSPDFVTIQEKFSLVWGDNYVG